MSNVDSARLVRWNAVRSDIPYNAESAIVKAWIVHPEWGSPISGEITDPDGSVAQAFTNVVVLWSGGDLVVSVQFA